jgi:hypothetical protein
MKKVLLSLALVSMTTLSAHAAEMDFATVDANSDGMVTMEEATAAGWEWSEDDFKAADTDANGSLNADEFAAASAE